MRAVEILDVDEVRVDGSEALEFGRDLVHGIGQRVLADAVELLGDQDVLGDPDRVLQQAMDEDDVDPDELDALADGLGGHVADVRDELQLEVGRPLAPRARAQVRRDVLPFEVEGPMHGRGGLEDLGHRGVGVAVGLAGEERRVALDLDEVEAGGGIDHLLEHPRGVDLGVRETHPMRAHVLGVATDVRDQQDRTAGFHALGSHLSPRFSIARTGHIGAGGSSNGSFGS